MLSDPRNVKLLELLSRNPRIPVADLARAIGLSAPATRERLARFQEEGVIRGFRVDIDPAALGLPMIAIVRVRPAPGNLPKATELARRTPQVVECHRVTGEDCLVMKVLLPTVEALEPLLDRFLAHGNTTTSIVQSSPVPPRLPPLVAVPSSVGKGRHPAR
jgi:Lrp/AsnC family leucine-responsive transcriptional regulator